MALRCIINKGFTPNNHQLSHVRMHAPLSPAWSFSCMKCASLCSTRLARLAFQTDSSISDSFLYLLSCTILYCASSFCIRNVMQICSNLYHIILYYIIINMSACIFFQLESSLVLHRIAVFCAKWTLESSFGFRLRDKSWCILAIIYELC